MSKGKVGFEISLIEMNLNAITTVRIYIVQKVWTLNFILYTLYFIIYTLYFILYTLYYVCDYPQAPLKHKNIKTFDLHDLFLLPDGPHGGCPPRCP